MAGMFSAAYLGVLEGFYALGKHLYYLDNDVFSYLVIAFVVTGCGYNMYRNYQYMKMMKELNDKEECEDHCCESRKEKLENLEP